MIMQRLWQRKCVCSKWVKFYSTGKEWTSKNIRSTYLDYFISKDHLFVPSSTVVPKKNEGSYFINAGMNQFKPIFMDTVHEGSSFATLKRAVNSQKCIRVGGKHNDLKDVGQDTSHHTFFEMLGSWSFGDYFKKEACEMAWELLTKQYQLPVDRLYVTYFAGNAELGVPPDLECRDIWLQIGVPEDKLLPFGVIDNFWDMGETGPCGPCTEIHYDHLGRENAADLVNTGSPEVVELWNLVFMQYNRKGDGSLETLPRQHVDTGMGLERLTAVLQHKHSNYDTDLFSPLFTAIQQISRCRPYSGLLGPADQGGVDTAYRIVADHIRMLTVAMADGVLPGRMEINSKVKHILHRCIRQAKEVLGTQKGSVASLVPVVVETLGSAFPELTKNVSTTMDVISYTEENYWRSVELGKKMFVKALSSYNLKPGQQITGEQAFEICQGRFGRQVSIDVLCDLAESQQLSVDVDSYEYVMHSHEAACNESFEVDDASALTVDDVDWLRSHDASPTDTSPVYEYSSKDSVYTFKPVQSNVVAIKVGGCFVKELPEKTRAAVIVEKTCFYPEQGGQVGDRGYLYGNDGCVFKVADTQQTDKYVLHIGQLEKGAMTTNCDVTLEIDEGHRLCCMCNHTATHLLNYSLQTVLGPTSQQGSYLDQSKLTFDFSLSSPLQNISSKELEEILSLANEIIDNKLSVYHNALELEKAKAVQGVRYLQNTNYPGVVRVISVGVPLDDLNSSSDISHSVELCGGTHVRNTGDIRRFCIIGVEGNHTSLKSVTAVTGEVAQQAIIDGENLKIKFSELKEWVQKKTNREKWGVVAKEIKQVLGVAVLPRLDREQVENDLAQLQMSLEQKRSLRESIQSEVRTQLEGCDPSTGIVCVLTLTNKVQVRDMVSSLGSLTVDVPVMLMCASKRQVVMGACYIPHNLVSEDLCADNWAQHVSRDMGTSQKAKDIHSKGKDIMTFLVKTRKGAAETVAEDLKHKAETFIQDRLKMEKLGNE